MKNKIEKLSSQSHQQTVEGEGGQAADNKIAPFPGYRDDDTVKREENDESWSEHTYDSEEEAHNRNICFSCLGLGLCCALIVASIIIVYMASTRDMKASII